MSVSSFAQELVGEVLAEGGAGVRLATLWRIAASLIESANDYKTAITPADPVLEAQTRSARVSGCPFDSPDLSVEAQWALLDHIVLSPLVTVQLSLTPRAADPRRAAVWIR